MNTAVSLPDKNSDEATKIAMGYKWYIFEGCAEGNRADMALLSEEEAEVVKRFFENRIPFYDEGYSGAYDMLSIGPFDSKEEVVKQYIEYGFITVYAGRRFNILHPEDFADEFKDMYKEEEE